MFLERGPIADPTSFVPTHFRRFGEDLEIAGIFRPVDNRPFSKRRSPVHEAVRSGCFGRVVELIEDGYRVDGLNAEQQTPLMVCCELGGRMAYQCARYLLEYGASLKRRDRVGFSPITVADSLGYDKFSNLFRQHATPEVIEADERFLLHKIAAHINGVVISSCWPVSLGISYFPVMHQTFEENLAEYLPLERSCFSAHQANKIVRSMENAHGGLSSEEMKLLFGEPVVIPCGWKGHFISLVFYGNLLFVCNGGEKRRGDKTISSYLIDRSRLDDALLSEILSMAQASPSLGAAYFYFGLPHKLHSKRPPTPEEKKLMFTVERFSPKPLKEDTCVWAALKGALRIVTICVKTEERDLVEFETLGGEAKKFTKRFSTAMRKGSTLECELVEGDQARPDFAFLRGLRENLAARLRKYPSHQEILPLFL